MDEAKIISLIKEIAPGLFASDPAVIGGRIRAIIDGHPEEEILAEGIVALLRKGRRNGTSLIK